MKKVRMILSLSALVIALTSAFAFAPVDTAWFALDSTTGQLQQYLGPTKPQCIEETAKYCAAEYPGVDANGNPVGQRIQTIQDAVRVP